MARLEDVHEALLNVKAIISRNPVPAVELEAARRAAKRHILLLPKLIADAEQLNTLLFWLERPKELKTTEGRIIDQEDVGLLQEPMTQALRYVEFRLSSSQSKDVS